jgi:hypothetical protein
MASFSLANGINDPVKFNRGYNNDASSMIKMHKQILNDDEKPTLDRTKKDETAKDTPTPIDEEKARKINVFPNPCTISFKISGVSEGDQIYIVNSAGQVVMNLLAQQDDPTVDVSNLSPGIYVVAIQNAKELNTIEFTK